MGNKISAVHGVKSDHFYDQGNAVNEIWVGDVEVISRLPFGDSDLEQAGWPKGDFPKIPWHHFIIPMQKRDEASNMTASVPSCAKTITCDTCQDWLPKHGYLGMYTSISSSAAYFIGALFLIVAFGTYLYFMSGVVTSFFNWQYLREASHLYPDPAAIRRMAKHNLWVDLGELFIVGALSILCLVLGVPAVAAGTSKMNAAAFVLMNGLASGIVGVTGLFVIPFALLWWTKKPRNVNPIAS
ncbi:hypothetical protein Pdw03_2526 [Penicillium digitatum]|uniref:Uncharacterized protein n=3 Tax=Penicillium digitatum TaxID=36651 RepID=K9FSB2_PEND2|nr:hypothetical protein PDIP_20940 [Penicillium digitatum Pd1]EKV11337.1 hypothetical protein PDIG_51740 [Penicillium digitatum PHI26]EKV19937.1 hypothetical protein PDIP_20940 [Penicillium digitatum Pd1]KAG0153252.1 hypothetical protein PDIDSM_5102 [Penicillium digitatum]QQK39672.1 hypothetical protein Pdw03_2526 [Penicillium digitatum]